MTPDLIEIGPRIQRHGLGCSLLTERISLPARIECGLTDDYDEVRLAFGMRKYFSATPEQVERGLTDLESAIQTFRQLKN